MPTVLIIILSWARAHWLQIAWVILFVFAIYTAEQYGENKIQTKWDIAENKKFIDVVTKKEEDIKYTYSLDQQNTLAQTVIRKTAEDIKKDANNETTKNPYAANCNLNARRLQLYTQAATVGKN
jgi:hypothetical protein